MDDSTQCTISPKDLEESKVLDKEKANEVNDSINKCIRSLNRNLGFNLKYLKPKIKHKKFSEEIKSKKLFSKKKFYRSSKRLTPGETVNITTYKQSMGKAFGDRSEMVDNSSNRISSFCTDDHNDEVHGTEISRI